MAAIFESKETISINVPRARAIEVLVEDLKAAGYRPRDTVQGLAVQTGSNFFLRLWGTMLPWGRKNVPVGLIVDVEDVTAGACTARIRAYDRLGWYLDARSNQALKKECEQKMAALTNVARNAIDPKL